MSWSVNATIEGGSPKDELAGLRATVLSQNAEARDQFEAAKDTVYILIASGALGNPDKTYHVTISGHANPDHEPREGWANDAITISVGQS